MKHKSRHHRIALRVNRKHKRNWQVQDASQFPFCRAKAAWKGFPGKTDMLLTKPLNY